MLKRNVMKCFLILLIAVLLLVTGCSQQANGPQEEEVPVEQEVREETSVEEEAEPEEVQEEMQREELPESIETTFLIEGMEEDMTLLLFQDDDMPFYTYYPEDMLFEQWIYDSEKGVRFFANFGGTINKSAYVEVKLFPVEAIGSESDFVSRISGESGLLANRGVEWVEKESELERIFSWSIIEFYYLDDEFTGALYLGQHEENFFYIDVHYPWEYGDGMESRSHVIMNEFLWTEQQRRLTE